MMIKFKLWKPRLERSEGRGGIENAFNSFSKGPTPVQIWIDGLRRIRRKYR